MMHAQPILQELGPNERMDAQATLSQTLDSKSISEQSQAKPNELKYN